MLSYVYLSLEAGSLKMEGIQYPNSSILLLFYYSVYFCSEDGSSEMGDIFVSTSMFPLLIYFYLSDF
ncbi:hypothetical protein B0A69_15840 [Chryseobacterium shigense]|nr:hypothetical protein B0A69_15840 [Chryseobacterium shigense]